jgi:tetratricopeptide (TPR) repeat protein
VELSDIRDGLNDLRGATTALEQTLYIYPMEMELHARLADSYAHLGRWGEAIRERQAVIALNPVDRAEALYQLAKTYFDSGDLGNARSVLLRALENAPNFQKAQELLLEIHGRSGTGQEG